MLIGLASTAGRLTFVTSLAFALMYLLLILIIVRSTLTTGRLTFVASLALAFNVFALILMLVGLVPDGDH